MKSLVYVSYLCYATLLISFLSGMFRYRIVDSASKILVALLLADGIFEILAYYTGRNYHNNIPVYTVHSLIEFGLICLYFGSSVDVLIKNKAANYIALAGILFGLVNIVFIQGINRMNSYFLVFEGLCVIGMALFSFFRILLHHDSLRLHKYHHFWFGIVLMFFWSVTFLSWSLYDYMNIHFANMVWIINLLIFIVNIITYTCFGIIFYLYPKMQKGDDR